MPPYCTETKMTVEDGGAKTLTLEDQSYVKASLGVKTDEERGTHKILGVE